MATPSERAKDPGAKMAGTPKGSDILRNSGRERSVEVIRLASSKYLQPVSQYRHQATPGCCLDLSGWEPEDFAPLRKLLLKTAKNFPGTYLWNSADNLEFPEESGEQIQFFVAAGFTRGDAHRLVQGDILP